MVNVYTTGLWQARFQLARLYKMKALGYAGAIDTSMGDVTALSEKLSPEMLVLLPFILFGQVFVYVIIDGKHTYSNI